MKDLIVEMKGRCSEILAYQFGILLGEIVATHTWSQLIDAIIPVPIFWTKQIRRNFHAASIIAEGVQKALQKPVYSNNVRCVRKTAKQGTLDTPERFRNVNNAFAVVRPSEIIGKHFLVVDDVMTSGATANQVARVLMRGQASLVRVAVVARGTRAR